LKSAHFFKNDDPSKSEVHIQLDKQTFVYLQTYDPDIKTGYNFTLEKFDGDELKERLTATSIKFDSLKNRWTIKMATIRYVNGLKEVFKTNLPDIDTVLDMRPVDFEAHDNVVSNIYGAMSLSVLNKAIEKKRPVAPG
jgi:lipopolysaccharide export system permease protein